MSTELELVNHLLRTVGDDSTSTLSTTHPSVAQARLALQGYNRDFQSKGWWFNRDYGVTWTPEQSGVIRVSPDILEFQLANPEHGYLNPSEKIRYTKRNGRVYDKLKQTSILNRTLIVDVVLLVDIDDIPDVAASYLRHMAAAEYYLDDDGDITKRDRLIERKDEAWANLQQAAIRYAAPNKLQTPFANKLRYRIGQFGSPSNPVLPGGRYR